MQDLENNMDELFNRASKDYPLKPGPDNWDEISSRILADTSPAVEPSKKHGRKKYFGLLLLLFFLLLGIVSLNRYGSKSESVAEERPSALRDPGTIKRKHPVEQLEKSQLAQGSTKYTWPNQKTAVAAEGRALAKTSVSQADGHAGIKTGRTKLAPVTSRLSEAHITTDNFTNAVRADHPAVAGTQIIPDDKQTRESDIHLPLRITVNNALKPAAVKAPDELHAFSRVNAGLPVPAKTMLSLTVPTGQPKSRKAFFSPGGLYYGLAAGPGLNSVKGQRLRKAGFDIGVVAGYRFGPRLSVETGLFRSENYYTTDGKYFSMKEMAALMPSGMQVMDVNGSSRMYKIPVSLRYAWTGRNGHRLFSAAGFSSYLMTAENNEYNTMMNGAPEVVYGSYGSDRHYFMAAIDLALGYEYNLSKRNSIRFEPYIQVPVRGIGIGSLPLTSTGLHVVITRSAH